MGNNQIANVNAEYVTPLEEQPFLHHMQLTHRPPTAQALAGFMAATGKDVFKDPQTLEVLAVRLTPNNYTSKLKTMGYTAADSTWWAVDAHFKPLGSPDPATGIREPIKIPDALYLCRRTRAVVSQVTFNFANNAEGRTIFKIDPARYVFDDPDMLYSRAAVEVESDGVLTVGDLRDDAIAQLNAITAFSAVYLAAAGVGAGEFTVTSLVPGAPLITELLVSSPGPNVTQTITTANVPGAYKLDLDRIQAALAEVQKNALVPVPGRKTYWITDAQLDDVVNAEGMEWTDEQGDKALHTPKRPYQFRANSTTGDKTIYRGADKIGNFDPTATESAAENAQQANGGEGSARCGVHDHPAYEFEACALLGRVIGHMPGEADFTAKELVGQTRFSHMTPMDQGDNEYLANSDERSFDWYSNNGPNGSHCFGATSNGSFCDRQWTEDYAQWLAEKRLTEWRVRRNIVQYTDPDIEAGSVVIAEALAEIPAIIADTIVVTWERRSAVNPQSLVRREYPYYTARCLAAGVVNKLGTQAQPIEITISESVG